MEIFETPAEEQSRAEIKVGNFSNTWNTEHNPLYFIRHLILGFNPVKIQSKLMRLTELFRVSMLKRPICFSQMFVKTGNKWKLMRYLVIQNAITNLAESANCGMLVLQTECMSHFSYLSSHPTNTGSSIMFIHGNISLLSLGEKESCHEARNS